MRIDNTKIILLTQSIFLAFAICGTCFGHAQQTNFPDISSLSSAKVVHTVDPVYTDAARKAHPEGICVVSVELDKKGKPYHITVIQPLGMGLDKVLLPL